MAANPVARRYDLCQASHAFLVRFIILPFLRGTEKERAIKRSENFIFLHVISKNILSCLKL